MPDDHADQSPFDDDPDWVRTTLKSTRSGPWFVFETFAADGSLAIGISSTTLPPGTVMVVYDGLTKGVAEQAAAGYHRWRLRQTTG